MDWGDVTKAVASQAEQADATPVEFSSASSSKSASVPKKPPFPSPAPLPTYNAPHGIRFDLNEGARVLLSNREAGQWLVQLRDLDTNNVPFEKRDKGALVMSSKRFYIRFGMKVWDVNEAGAQTEIFSHEYNAHDRDILIQLPVGTLDDGLAWFPYAARFARTHGARVTSVLSELIIPLLAPAYPELRLVSPKQVEDEVLAEWAYSTYGIGLFFNDKECIHQPTDFLLVGLHRTAAYILGVDPQEVAPRLALLDDTKPIAEPYVCIAAQSSTQCKYWNNSDGAETLSRILDWTERGSCVFFADGTGAAILEAGDADLGAQSRGILSTHLHSDARHRDKIYTDGGPSSTSTVGRVHLEGREVFFHASINLAAVAQEALDANALSAADIDWFVPHQANQRIIEEVGLKFNFPKEKTIATVQHHKNIDCFNSARAGRARYRRPHQEGQRHPNGRSWRWIRLGQRGHSLAGPAVGRNFMRGDTNLCSVKKTYAILIWRSADWMPISPTKKHRSRKRFGALR